MSIAVERLVHLSEERASRLGKLALDTGATEEELINHAVDILLNIAEPEDPEREREAWQSLGIASLERVWSNEADAVYDDWRTLYAVHEG